MAGAAGVRDGRGPAPADAAAGMTRGRIAGAKRGQRDYSAGRARASRWRALAIGGHPVHQSGVDPGQALQGCVLRGDVGDGVGRAPGLASAIKASSWNA